MIKSGFFEFQFHPSALAFATASEDYTARLFDIRADQEVSLYKASAPNVGFTSTVLSKSGRFLIAGGDDGSAHIWDALKSVYLGTY
jgi:guanine nucleotide-binding protein subunit beta